MKHFKRLGMLLVIMIVTLSLFAVSAAAEDIGTGTDTPASDVVTDDTIDAIPEDMGGGEAPEGIGENDTATEEENTTVIARVYEWASVNIDKILTFILSAFMCVYTVYQKNKNGMLIQGVGKVLKSQNGVESAAALSSEKMDKLEAKQAQLNEYYEEYAKNENERNRVNSALLVEVMALIEIQHILCLNNPSIAQPMKALVTSKYARCLSVINDDSELKAAYDKMRETLGITGDHAHEKTHT